MFNNGNEYCIIKVETELSISKKLGGDPMEYVVEMLNIRKEFPGIVANDNITLQLKKGEIHALLGENGAGKSTLMGMLFGMYQPEKGTLLLQKILF